MPLSREQWLESALRLIVALGDKTLIMASDDARERQAYSLGANRAFQQAADMANDALRALPVSDGEP